MTIKDAIVASLLEKRMPLCVAELWQMVSVKRSIDTSKEYYNVIMRTVKMYPDTFFKLGIFVSLTRWDKPEHYKKFIDTYRNNKHEKTRIRMTHKDKDKDNGWRVGSSYITSTGKKMTITSIEGEFTGKEVIAVCSENDTNTYHTFDLNGSTSDEDKSFGDLVKLVVPDPYSGITN